MCDVDTMSVPCRYRYVTVVITSSESSKSDLLFTFYSTVRCVWVEQGAGSVRTIAHQCNDFFKIFSNTISETTFLFSNFKSQLKYECVQLSKRAVVLQSNCHHSRFVDKK